MIIIIYIIYIIIYMYKYIYIIIIILYIMYIFSVGVCFIYLYSKVFLLRRKSDKINVVIKQIPVDDLPIEERRVSMNEVSVLKMLKHPNIVAYYDSFVEDKSLMIAMEYAPGGTLYEFIMERNGKLLSEEVFWKILFINQPVHERISSSTFFSYLYKSW